MELTLRASFPTLSLGRDRTIFVRTLSTGVVHPFVVGHSGCFKLWEGNSGLSSDVYDPCVRGDCIAAITHLRFISIWNWKTGALVSYQVLGYVIVIFPDELTSSIHRFPTLSSRRSTSSM